MTRRSGEHENRHDSPSRLLYSSPMLCSAQVRALSNLKGEARELMADPDACRKHVLDRVAELLHGSAGFVVRGVNAAYRRDIVTRVVLHNFDGVTRPAFEVLMQRGGNVHALVDEQLGRMVGARGVVETLAAKDLRRGPWRETEYYVDYVRPSGLGDAIISVNRYDDPAVHFGFALFREHGARPFTDDDKLLLECIELGLGDLAHRPDEPPRPAHPLTPRERDVLDAMLAGLSDKEISARLGITRHTVNQYAKRLFLTFDVHSRGELIALHLRVART